MIPIRLLPEAEMDIVEAAVFLDERLPGLGDRFADAITSSLQRIAEHPEIGPKVGRDIRKLLVWYFPYNVIYRIEAEEVLVLAIAHHRRRPGFWRKRG